MVKPYEGIFGNTPELKLFEYLIPLKGLGFNALELAKEINTTVAQTYRIAENLVKWDVLTVIHKDNDSRQIRNTLYSINHDSLIVQAVISLDNAILYEMLDSKDKDDKDIP